MQKGAILDKSGKYRYQLVRQWRENSDNFVNFVLLNPSTADAVLDDPTIKACISFATNWGFDGLYVTNLFAFRATKPEDLKKAADPIGPLNNNYIQETASKSKMVVFAWGNHGSFMQRNEEVTESLSKTCTPYCIQLLKDGQPKHPLYIKRETRPTALKQKMAILRAVRKF